jgi:hypothetical protein
MTTFKKQSTMKKTIYTTLFLLAVLLGIELKAQSVSYQVTKDDPYDVKNFTLAIDPLFFDVNGENGYAFGWGARANWLMGKTLDLNFDIRNGFGTHGYDIDNKNTRNYFAMEGSLALTLSHKTHQRNLPIILSSSSYTSGGYTYTTTYSIKGGVPGTVRSIIAFRAGAYQITNSINLSKTLNDSLLMLRDKGADVKFSYKDSLQAMSLNQYGGFASTAVFAGFNFKTIKQLIVDVDGWGTRQNAAYSDFFVDCIFSPVIALKNYEHTNKTTGQTTKYDLKYEGGKRAIGWRIGYQVRKPKDQGFSFKWELGQRPGFKADNPGNKSVNLKNWYTMLTYGLYIPLKVKPVAHPE